MKGSMLHHAYLIYGFHDNGMGLVDGLMASINEVQAQNSNVRLHRVDSCTIDDVRMVRDMAYQMPMGDGHAWVILSAGTLHEEAQQALLKVLEEPGDGVIVSVIVPPGTTILPTILSRCEVRHAAQDESISPIDAKKFLSANPKERLALVDTFLKSLPARPHGSSGAGGDDEDIHSKTQSLIFLDTLERLLFSEGKKLSPEKQTALSDIANMRGFLTGKSASIRYILEFLALAL
ncbi:MAG: hypothetical protein KBC98_01490 [Candidatus Pacebacteria bacterium]|nr:hypothetical protein [Candidatus Paceibacterota bacterium]